MFVVCIRSLTQAGMYSILLHRDDDDDDDDNPFLAVVMPCGGIS